MRKVRPMAQRRKLKATSVHFSPKGEEQEDLIQSFKDNYLTVCRSRHFGNGKTFCAIGYACSLLMSGETERVVFCCDSREMVDRMGYLPGNRAQKVAAKVRFATKYFKLFLGDEYESFTHKIEYCDVAELDGETFVDSFLILDEAASCDMADITMFISRCGHGTRCAVLGTDRQANGSSSLGRLFRLLGEVPGVGLIELQTIMRNGWLEAVLNAIDDG